MEHIHHPAIDVASGFFDATPTHRPRSTHAFLSRTTIGFPSHAPSSALESSRGFAAIVGLEPAIPAATSSSPSHGSLDDGPLAFRLLGTKAWSSFDHHSPGPKPTQQWMGVEVGNMHVPSAPSRRTQWNMSNYFVRSGAEQVLDHSLFVRVNRAPKVGLNESSAAIAGSPSLPPSSFTVQSSLVANLTPGPPIASAPDLLGPKANLLVGGLEVGYDRVLANGSTRSKLFANTDGLVLGGSICTRWDRPASSAVGHKTKSKYAWWPRDLSQPFSVRFDSTTLGLEGAWIQELKDYSGTFGLQQRFQIASAERSSPLITLAGTFQFYGHVAASLHVPVTRRLTVASTFHTQITNDESLLVGAASYRVNAGQRATLALDSRGGVRVSCLSRLRTPRTDGTSWLQKFLSRTTFQAHVQAFPTMTALQPAWNNQMTGLTGSVYSPQAIAATKQPNFSFGFALEYNAD